MGNYLFSLTPTFTQGLILGQLSILLLLYFILKYLFFDSKSSLQGEENLRRHTNNFAVDDSLLPPSSQTKVAAADTEYPSDEPESAEWMNALLQQVCIVTVAAAMFMAHFVSRCLMNIAVN